MGCLTKGSQSFAASQGFPRKELSPFLEGDHCFKVCQKLRLKQRGLPQIFVFLLEPRHNGRLSSLDPNPLEQGGYGLCHNKLACIRNYALLTEDIHTSHLF